MFFIIRKKIMFYHWTTWNKFKRNIQTSVEEIRDVTANCFCFCHIINSLLTELVRSVQEDTAGLVLFRLFVDLAYGLVQKSEKRTRPCSILLYGPLGQS